MIHGDMSVTEFVMTLWNNKIKLAGLLLALIFGPQLYEDWQRQRESEKREVERQAVDKNASITGMMLASAWTSCKEIGIVNDMERCAEYKGRLLQEIAAPKLAKIAIEHRDSYYRGCQQFYPHEYCGSLLSRSLQFSITQQRATKSD